MLFLSMSSLAIEWAQPDPQKRMEVGAGLYRTILWEGEQGARAQLFEIEAGACFPGIDIHEPGPEEVFVLSGVFNDGIRDYPAGTFIHNPAGSSHIPQSKDGCTLFVFFPEG